jgi:hypothetical protein
MNREILNVMKSKCFRLFSFNTYEHNLYIKYYTYMYTLCSYVLKINKLKHLLFMPFLKSSDSLTQPVFI